MPDYDSSFSGTPAPIAFVTLKNFEESIEIIDVPMLLDTGSDATLLPQIFAETFGSDSSETEYFELEAFDKTTS